MTKKFSRKTDKPNLTRPGLVRLAGAFLVIFAGTFFFSAPEAQAATMS